MSMKQTSQYIALILRHKPSAIGITLDEHGWADAEELIAGVSKTHPLDRRLLEELIIALFLLAFSWQGNGLRRRSQALRLF